LSFSGLHPFPEESIHLLDPVAVENDLHYLYNIVIFLYQKPEKAITMRVAFHYLFAVLVLTMYGGQV
jgi:hypothetical protein